jgi:hypothetical protein
MIEIEDIWLTQDIHVTGDTLCQDGQYIYFKNRVACQEATNEWNCKKSLKISPIHFIQKIELPSGQSITHFYNIKTQFDFLRYELTSFYPIKSFDLVESKQIEFPLCKKMIMKKPLKVRSIRPALDTEKDFIQGLIDSGVVLLNSPYGSFNELADNLINSEKDPLSQNELPHLKSPLCNTNVDANEMILKASGEWSGNGIVQISALNEWQRNSNDLKVILRKDQQNVKRFEFYCIQEDKREL